MLKVRVIPSLLFKHVGLVKGIQFDSWRRTGSTMQTVKVYNLREVDEMIFLDITATREGRLPDFETVDDIADECFVPLGVGGGVRTLDDVRRLLSVGADKVVVGSSAVEHPELVSAIAERFGSQCAVVSIDVKRAPRGYEVWSHSGTVLTEFDPIVYARAMEERGAGEILLTSIDRDGTMRGYDIELIQQVTAAVRIPVIASGGAGSYEDMAEAVRAGASAVAAASIFHFTEMTPLEAKRYLHGQGIAVRL